MATGIGSGGVSPQCLDCSNIDASCHDIGQPSFDQKFGVGQPQIVDSGQITKSGVGQGELNSSTYAADGNVTTEKNKKTYTGLFSDNRAPSDASQLTFIEPPVGHLVLDMEEIDSVEKAFGYCLIGYVMGPRPSPYAMNNYVKRWGKDVKFTFKENGWIRLQFPSVEIRDKVVNGGPYMIFGKQLFIKHLPSCFMYSKEDMAFVPSWVQIFGLPSDCWTVKALSKIASVVGKPLHTDMLTITKKGAKFARVLVEINAKKERLREYSVVLPTGKIISITFKYEFEPKFCEKCDCLGHTVESCAIEHVRYRQKFPTRQSDITHVDPVVNPEAPDLAVPMDPKVGCTPELGEETHVITETMKVSFADILKTPVVSDKRDLDTQHDEQLSIDTNPIEHTETHDTAVGQNYGKYINEEDKPEEDFGMLSTHEADIDMDTDDLLDDLSYVIYQGWQTATGKKRNKRKARIK